MTGALPYAGLRVLDLSQGIAGPSSASMLARLGAEVVKVEPLTGDWGRLMGGGRDGMTALSIWANLGKRSVCVDARSSAGRELLLRMSGEADVLVESFRPGVVERLGLGYDGVAAHNPRVVYASVSGFGSAGPYRDEPATDSILQAVSGMMAMNRDAQGTPRRVGMLLVDVAAGVYVAHAIAAALLQRAATGRGRHLLLSLLEVTAALQAHPILDAAMHPGGAPPPVTVPSGTFRTADGLVNLAALRDEMFFALGRAIGHPEWEAEPAYRTNDLRRERAAEINAAIQRALVEEPTERWVERFRAADVLCAPVLDYAGFRAHPQVLHERLFSLLEQPGSGAVPIAGLPGFGAVPPAPAPRMGEHTAEVLRSYGLDAAEVARLESAGVIRLDRPSGGHPGHATPA